MHDGGFWRAAVRSRLCMTTGDTINLTNQLARATLWPKRGGLLRDLRLTADNGTYDVLWSNPDFAPNKTTWPMAGCPVMFPFAGRVWSEGQLGRYAIGDHEFPMELHGFAYQQPWQVVRADPSSCHLQLRDTPVTQEIFPFSFTLAARYNLEPRRLTVQLELTNNGAVTPREKKTPMPIAMGLHPFFRVPLKLQSKWQACAFSAQAEKRLAVTAEGNAAAKKEKRTHMREVMTDASLRSSIITDLKQPECMMIDPSGVAVKISWPGSAENIENIVLWSKPEAGYFCMEPWMGLPDAPSRKTTKKIAAGETLRLDFVLQLHIER